MTPQRELIFRSFFELGEHVSVDELYAKVRQIDKTVGYSTVWRNLKLMSQVGLAEEVNLGDGVTRYDPATQVPHGHLYCRECKQLVEFDMDRVIGLLVETARGQQFVPENFRVEVQGLCKACQGKKPAGEQS